MTPVERVHAVVDRAGTGRGARAFRADHHGAIAAGVFALIAGTVTAYADAHRVALGLLWHGAALFFAAEFALRLYAAPAADPAPPAEARRHWLHSAPGLVDLAGLLPLALAASGAVEPGSARLAGLIWLFKLAPYSAGFMLLVRVVRNARAPLRSVLLAFLIVLLGAATLQHVLEREAQPETFGSIPAAMWWTIVTLTTTGYGDVVPVTPLGRVLAGTVMICGIAVFALWAGILATGFAEELRRRDFLRAWDLVAKVPFLHALGAGTIADVSRLLRPEQVGGGAVLMRRGQRGDCMYFIVDGEVEVTLDRGPIRLGGGDFFGELALVTAAPRNATVTATRPTTLLALDVADFRDLAARRPELTAAVEAEAARRLAAAPPRS